MRRWVAASRYNRTQTPRTLLLSLSLSVALWDFCVISCNLKILGKIVWNYSVSSIYFKHAEVKTFNSTAVPFFSLFAVLFPLFSFQLFKIAFEKSENFCSRPIASQLQSSRSIPGFCSNQWFSVYLKSAQLSITLDSALTHGLWLFD